MSLPEASSESHETAFDEWIGQNGGLVLDSADDRLRAAVPEHELKQLAEFTVDAHDGCELRVGNKYENKEGIPDLFAVVIAGYE